MYMHEWIAIEIARQRRAELIAAAAPRGDQRRAWLSWKVKPRRSNTAQAVAASATPVAAR